MRRIIVPLVFAFLIAAAGTLGSVLPASADESAKPVHGDGGCPFENIEVPVGIKPKYPAVSAGYFFNHEKHSAMALTPGR